MSGSKTTWPWHASTRRPVSVSTCSEHSRLAISWNSSRSSAHEIGLTGLDERALDRGQGLLEDAEHEAVLHVGLRARGALAPVLVEDADHGVREGRAQLPVRSPGARPRRPEHRSIVGGAGKRVGVTHAAGLIEARGPHAGLGRRSVPVMRGPVEHEDLDRHVRVEDDLAVVRDDPRAGETLDLSDERPRHDVLERQPRATDERAASRLLERDLDGGKHVVEDREDDPVADEGPRARRPLAVELALDPRHRVRDPVPQRALAERVSVIRHEPRLPGRRACATHRRRA